jgi:KipI family sensor histidine kinase inhibitor
VVTRIRAIRPVGDRALLVELDSLAQVLSLQAQLLEHPVIGQLDVLAAAETVLVSADSTVLLQQVADHIWQLDVSTSVPGDDTLVVIDTLYDGEDLDAVGALTGLGADGVVAAHTRQVWTAAFGGFAPGFTYLVGQDETLTVPRRDSPRTAVPAGSVGLAGNYSAVYPRASPGGWQLIGRTAARMWDLDRASPALVRPGNRVQFRAVRDLVALAAEPATRAATAPVVPVTGVPVTGVPVTGVPDDGVAATDPVVPREAAPATGVVIRSPGLQTTVQDLGRRGYAELGVVASGALDRGALRRANRFAGNPATAAVLENALGGLTLEALSDQVLAVTGAVVRLEVTGADGAKRVVAAETPFALLAGERLTLGAPTSGVRSYVAFRGGVDVPEVLGSRSTDTLSSLGPAPLAAGDVVAVLPAPATSVVVVQGTKPEPIPEVTELPFVPGPRADWFTPQTLDRFADQVWTVTAQSNRIGLRLDGVPLTRSRTGELKSEGTVSGAIQVPPSGLPVLFLADHPITGGYPVLGVVLHADLDKAAQLPTGAKIRFVPAPDAAPVEALAPISAQAPGPAKES